MASNYTTNYQLNQWEPTDAVQRVEFNQDNAKVDTALKSLSDQVVQKADQSALNTLISAVNQKADASTVTELSGEVDQIEANLTKIVFGSYTGDGAESRKITLSAGTPKAVLLFTNWGMTGSSGSTYGGLATQSVSLKTYHQTATALNIVTGGFRVYYKNVDGDLPYTNYTGKKYVYAAFFAY